MPRFLWYSKALHVYLKSDGFDISTFISLNDPTDVSAGPMIDILFGSVKAAATNDALVMAS
jgi:hypothetical protein